MSALTVAAAAGAAFGAVFALLSPTLAMSLIGSLLFAAALGFVLDTGLASYSRAYLAWITPVALWITGPLLAFGAVRTWQARPLHPAAAFVLAFSSAVLFIKIVTLLHPSKAVVDAVFHAHRLGAVLGGSYYFTQPMPGGVQFPYAIGLYVMAAPWASLVRDHVALLRIVVCVAEAIAAGLLYVAVSRIWSDRLTGALAVVLYHLAPLPYVVIGNANLTYAFAQSMAVITVVAATTLTPGGPFRLKADATREGRSGPFGRRNLLAAAALFAIASLAFLSHVGVFPILAVTLVAIGALYWTFGGPALRPAALGIVVVTVLAAGFAVGSDYAHFPEVYRTLSRVTAPAAQAPVAQGEAAVPAPQKVQPALTIAARAARAASLGVRGLGWPLVVLAALGLWLLRTAPRDRLTLALGGWGVSFAVFVAFRVLAPVDARYQRYADEFIDRVYYATLPAVAILAGLALAWGWRGTPARRMIAALGLAAAAVTGVQLWTSWIL